jgi:hypothetical protein
MNTSQQHEEARFTAYKIYVDDQSRDGFARNLTLAQVRNEVEFPLGPQFTAAGRKFVWSYGINDGSKVV